MERTEQECKLAIREAILARRNALSPADRRDLSDIIFTRVVRAWEWQQARSVLLYASFGSEVQTDRLMRMALRSGKRLILPRVGRGPGELDLYYVEDILEQLIPGTWSIREPDPECCTLSPPGDIDCIITPGVAFDCWGGRLGYGGGYYDRLLSSLAPDQAARTLALAFELQIVREVPRGVFDTPVSVIATEMRLVTMR